MTFFGSLIGNTDFRFLDGVEGDTLVSFVFLMTFAAITPALISGAVADRMKFAAWAIFVPVWSLLVYSPVGFWIYGDEGWIHELPALDFAGGTVVHVNAGMAALAAALRCRFTPAKQRDFAVPVWVAIPYNFRLR